MSLYDEARFPNAFVRFRRLAGLVSTVLWIACSAFFVVLTVLDVFKSGTKSPFLGCVAGAALALVIRKVMFLKPEFTMHALRGMWLVIMIYIFIVHRTIGAPTWSSWLMFGLAGFYLAATFAFYSSKFLYLGKVLSEMPDRHTHGHHGHEEDDEKESDALVDQEVDQARPRKAPR